MNIDPILHLCQPISLLSKMRLRTSETLTFRSFLGLNKHSRRNAGL